jgi:metallophosphoesterase superfamily enzyme
MKYFFLSDLHTDFWWPYANERSEYEQPDPPEEVTRKTLDHLWRNQKRYDYPTDVDGIVVPGDLGNDWNTQTWTLKWLREKYNRVIYVPGNHDIAVRGGTSSKSNLPFKTSVMKIEALRKFCEESDITMLEGDVVDGIGGCMMMTDFSVLNPDLKSWSQLNWKRHWYDGKTWRYFDNQPDEIMDHYRELMDKIVAQKPNVIVTHFAPSIMPIPFDSRNDPCQNFFYFDAHKWLNEIEHDTIWICGHVHANMRATYLNKKGALITCMCNPQGYPEDMLSSICCSEEAEGEIGRKLSHEELATEKFIIDV